MVLITFAITSFCAGQETGDEAAIQKLIDALGPEGGTVELEAKTYTVRDTIVLRDNVTLAGAGMDKTIIKMADGACAEKVEDPWQLKDVVKNENHNEQISVGNFGMVVRDLTIDGNADNNPYVGCGVALANNWDYAIENVHTMNCRGYAGIITWPDHRAANRERKNYIVGCIAEKNQAALDRDSTYGHGMYITAWDNDNVLIKDNICRDNYGSGIHLEDRIKHIFVIDNECYDNGQHGIWIAFTSYSTIRGNRLYRNTRGIQSVSGYYNLIIDNEIFDNRLEGIYIGPWGCVQYDTPEYEKPTHNVVIGNVIRNNNNSYMDAGAGIYCEMRGNVFAFNHVYDDRVDARQFIGIWCLAPDNVVINNYLKPHAYRQSEGFADFTGGKNTYVPWDYEKPWTPENLVSSYTGGAGEQQ